MLGSEIDTESDDLSNEIRYDSRLIRHYERGDRSDTSEEEFEISSSSEDDAMWEDIERYKRMGPGLAADELEASKGISRLPYPILKNGQFNTVVTPQIDLCPKLHNENSR